MSIGMRRLIFLVSGKKGVRLLSAPMTVAGVRWNCQLPKECAANSTFWQLWFSLGSCTVYWTVIVTTVVQLHRLFFDCILYAGQHVKKIEGTVVRKTFSFPSRSYILGDDIKHKTKHKVVCILCAVFMLWTKFWEGMKEKLGEDHILGKGKNIKPVR